MRTFLLFISISFVTLNGQAQNDVVAPEDTTFTIDLLRAPTSPASNLLNFSTSQIEKPTDPAGFIALAQQKTNNFSTLPTDIAVDVAPIILFAGSKMTLKNFESNKFSDNFRQTFILSIATQTLDSLESETLSSSLRQVAFGSKFSIIRGKLNRNFYKILDDIRQHRKELLEITDSQLDSLLNNDKIYQELKHRFDEIRKDTALTRDVKVLLMNEVNLQRTLREKTLIEELQFKNTEQYKKIKQLVEGFTYTRYGWKLDMSGGIVLDYPNQNFDNGKISKAGIWLLGGYEGTDGISFLGLMRYLYNPDKVFTDKSDLLMIENISTLDLGLRILYSNIKSKFGISGEIISRNAYTNNDMDEALRWSVNATYDVGKNKQLQFVYGRNFDNTITKKADLIAALSFLIGFGAEKGL